MLVELTQIPSHVRCYVCGSTNVKFKLKRKTFNLQVGRVTLNVTFLCFHHKNQPNPVRMDHRERLYYKQTGVNPPSYRQRLTN